MDLSHLKLFCEIATHGSLTKTSIALDVEQSVISRQLQALENQLGARLFHRTGRGMALTDVGKSFLPKANALLEDADKILEEMRSEVGIVSGEVRVGILPALSYPAVNKLYQQLRSRYPRLHLQFFEGSNGQLIEWIGTGKLDLAVFYRYSDIDGSEIKVLGTSEACLISRADDPLTENSEVPFSKLEGLPLLLPSRPNSLRASLETTAKKYGFIIKVAMEADSLPIQKNMVLDGHGYAILGAASIIREREAGLLRALRIVDPTIVRTAVIAASSQKPYTVGMRVVAKALEPLIEEVLDPR